MAAARSSTSAPLNLADLYRAIGREADAEAVLRPAITQVAEPALVHHDLGLTLVRMGRSEAALAELRRAHELAPADVRLRYTYAVALFDGGRHQAALATLEALHRQYPGNRGVLPALAGFSQQLGQPAQAAAYAAKRAKL